MHTFSVQPAIATKVGDVPGLVEASHGDATKLWREAVADIFAVGFWRRTYPRGAEALISTLKQDRIEHQSGDRTHATMCWIDEAAAKPLAPSMDQLFDWADKLRMTAKC